MSSCKVCLRGARIALLLFAAAIVLSACGGSGGKGGGSGNCLERGCKISARDGEANENFGSTVGVRAAVVAVGAPDDAEGGSGAGSAYVFRVGRRDADQERKLIASDAEEDDAFGRSVAVGRDDLVIVGSLNDDDLGTDSGSAYVYRLVGDVWTEEQKLTAPDGDVGDRFGRSVSATPDVIVVGADLDDDDNNGIDSGSAYVFRFNGATWDFEQKLTASDGATDDDFGDSVSVDGDVIVVGAGNDGDNGVSSGSAYVYRFAAGAWTEEQKLVADDGAEGDEFGDPVAVHGDVIVIGADDDDDVGDNSGSVYVYRFEAGVWGLDQKLTATDGEEGDDFGESVALTDDMIVVGAIGDDDGGSRSGSVYVYRYDGTDWIEGDKLEARDASRSDAFGTAVAIDSGVIVVGANGEDGRGRNSGAAYVFEF